jgi:hypothetical protein
MSSPHAAPAAKRAHGDVPEDQSPAAILRALESLVQGERNLVANLANASSLLFHSMVRLFDTTS